jgi:hypothetical protein
MLKKKEKERNGNQDKLKIVISPAVCVISLKCLVMAALPIFFYFLSLNNIFLYVLIKEFPGMLNVYAKKKRKRKEMETKTN